MTALRQCIAPNHDAETAVESLKVYICYVEELTFEGAPGVSDFGSPTNNGNRLTPSQGAAGREIKY